MIEEVVGFSAKQREWVKARDGHRCMHHSYDPISRKWKRCGSTMDLQVHHIIPRGWCKLHLPRSFSVNGSLNAITLCRYHHVGKDSVHPDTFLALLQYQQGNKQAFAEMMQERRKLNEKGMPYWNTLYDWMYSRLAKKNTGKYVKKFPYPENKNRGKNGRIKEYRNRNGNKCPT